MNIITNVYDIPNPAELQREIERLHRLGCSVEVLRQFPALGEQDTHALHGRIISYRPASKSAPAGALEVKLQTSAGPVTVLNYGVGWWCTFVQQGG